MACTLNGCNQNGLAQYQQFCSVQHLQQFAQHARTTSCD